MTEDDIRPLSVREGRRLPRGAPHEPVPSLLKASLQSWADRKLTPHLQRRISLRMEIAYSPSSLAWRQKVDLLEVIDLVLQLDPQLQQDLAQIDEEVRNAWRHEDTLRVVREVPEAVEELDNLLTDGNSTYRVARQARPLQLISIVDATVGAAVTAAIGDASETASDLLASAWVATHAVHPDPDGAYRDAVRAVEVAISTVVSPDNGRQTLGTAVRDLRNGAHNYELVLLDKSSDGSVEPLQFLLERLWEGQKSRHGAGDGARPSTLEEARAAVQIAVLVVQWLTDDVLRRRTPPGAS